MCVYICVCDMSPYPNCTLILSNHPATLRQKAGEVRFKSQLGFTNPSASQVICYETNVKDIPKPSCMIREEPPQVKVATTNTNSPHP